jgi:hypothetical protein
MTDRFEKLLEIATEQEQIELKVLHNALIETVKAYKSNPSASNKKNWDAARIGLDEIIERYWSKYFQEEPAFKDRSEAVKYLQEQGYKVKKSKVYADAKKGLLRVQHDGRVLKVDLKAYAISTLDKVNKQDEALAEQRTVTKVEKQIEKTDAQIDRLRFDLEREMGKYIPKGDFEMEIAARAAVLDIGIRHWIQSFVEELIYICGGDPKAAGEIIEKGNETLDKLMNDFASTKKFQVIILGDESGS